MVTAMPLSCPEPTIDDLLDDPIVRALMEADGVEREDFGRRLRRVNRQTVPASAGHPAWREGDRHRCFRPEARSGPPLWN